MPNLNLGVPAKEAAKARFRSFNLKLPAIPPSGGSPLSAVRPQLIQRFMADTAMAASTVAEAAMRAGVRIGVAAPSPSPPPSVRPTATPMASPPALFGAASNSKDDVDYQIAMHDLFNGLFDGIIDAIEFGFNLYRLQAALVEVVINGPVATGGRLQGPPMDGLIARAPAVAAWSGWDAMVRDAVAKGLGYQWSMLAGSVGVPGLPWYPAFAAFPGPVAPPMPNVPTPFIILVRNSTAMSAQNLKMAMRMALNGNMDFCNEFFESIATALQLPLQMWMTTQQVTQVLGSGPIPTFAPPYVPVGPVLGGSTMAGQHLLA